MSHRSSDIETGFARVGPAGLRLHYRRGGADGPTVVLLHGWPETGYAWRHVLPTLASAGYTVVAPDLRGSGDSDKPSGGYDPQTLADDVRSLLRALGLDDRPAFVVGHSSGGAAVAQAYAQCYSDETAALALVSAVPGQAGTASAWHAGFHQTPDLPEMLIGPHLEPYLRHFFQAWSHDPHMLSPSDLAVYVRHLAEHGALRASLAPFRSTSQTCLTGRGKVPLLLLVGESDPHFTGTPAFPAGVRLQTIPRGGHWLPEERPDPVAAALLTFFAEARERDGG